ncbi:MAG TPA: RNA polymerase factor sigma-54 [Nannocystaceae bacterium]|nr:RNA polymerase factor sigma-54 [Nannocystaceae bacterium]
MALNMRQELRMSQQLVMTPQLQQAIKLLQLSRIELQDLVRSELLENPLLDEHGELGSTVEEPVSSVEMQDGIDMQRDEGERPASREREEVKVDDATPKENFDWEAYLENQSYSPSTGSGVRVENEDLPSLEATATRPETLAEHLMWQIRLSNFGPVAEDIAEYIVRSISPAGYMRDQTVPQIAKKSGYSCMRIEETLRKIQNLDPISIGARNLAEALWIQANAPDDPIEDPLVRAIIAKHLGNLEKRAYQAIARDTGETMEEVYEAAKVVLGLEPRPARAYASEEPQYIVPDVYIAKIGEEYVVTLNDDGLPKLKISGFYRGAMGSSREAKEYITERLRSAQWLIRSIQQRQRTILKVTKSILRFQREFFDRGVEHLRPLILKDVAEDIQMHESTVSRVTTNKYVHTPQGIFELKYFFNAGISRSNGEDLASEAVKTKIKQLIDAEDGSHPYSDQKLVELLKADGIDIARRTVAKYREQLGVLSSSKRRRLF